jgi:hypothetical protein
VLLLLASCVQPVEPPPPQPFTPTPWPAPTAPALPVVPPPCWDAYVGAGLPVVTTAATGDAADACGATGPGYILLWTAPDAGPYTVTATASFPVEVEVNDGTSGSCFGPVLACGASGAATFTAEPGHLVNIVVVAPAGAGGAFQLAIDGPPGSCGDGTCAAEEDCASCPGDCGVCPSVCGDGVCAGDEDCAGCPGDCGACSLPEPDDSGPICGDGICDASEDSINCPQDCYVAPSFCGDFTCDLDEDCTSCPTDCTICP